MKFIAKATNVEFELTNNYDETVLSYQYDNVAVSMDFVKFVEVMPAIKEKIDELQAALDGR